MVYVCSGCEAKSPAKDGIKHDDEEHKEKKDKTIKRTCEKSGTSPHQAGK